MTPLAWATWILYTLLTVSLLVKLLRIRLGWEYGFLTLYLAEDLIQQLAEMTLVRFGRFNLPLYQLGQTLQAATLLLIVLSLADRKVHGVALRVASERVRLYLLLATAVMVLTFTLLLSPTREDHPRPLLDFVVFERSLNLVALIVQLLLSAFLKWFQVRATPNVRILSNWLLLTTLSNWLLLLATEVAPRLQVTLSEILVIVGCALLGYLIVNLRRPSEITESLEVPETMSGMQLDWYTQRLRSLCTLAAKLARLGP